MPLPRLLTVTFASVAALACQRQHAPVPGPTAAPDARPPDAVLHAVVPAMRPPDAAGLLAPGGAAPAGPWIPGRQSRLRLQTLRFAKHDRDYGATAIEIEWPGTPRAPRRLELEGLWSHVAYAESANAHVLAGRLERGAWLPIDELVYADDRSGDLRPSRYSRTAWMAMAAAPGPGGSFVAFVGRIDERQPFALQVLDTFHDQLVTVGAPPAPPPDPSACQSSRRFRWGDPVDGYVDLDAGIVTFEDPATLNVSYGADTCSRRSGRRQTRTWDLVRVFARTTPLAPRRE